MSSQTTPVVITSETFDALKTGQIVRVAFSGCMASGSREVVVGRRSHSKKHNVTTLALNSPGGRSVHEMCRLRLYKRRSGISLALGDMHASLTMFDVQA